MLRRRRQPFEGLLQLVASIHQNRHAQHRVATVSKLQVRCLLPILLLLLLLLLRWMTLLTSSGGAAPPRSEENPAVAAAQEAGGANDHSELSWKTEIEEWRYFESKSNARRCPIRRRRRQDEDDSRRRRTRNLLEKKFVGRVLRHPGTLRFKKRKIIYLGSRRRRRDTLETRCTFMTI